MIPVPVPAWIVHSRNGLRAVATPVTCGTAPAATEAAPTESPSGPSPQGVKP